MRAACVLVGAGTAGFLAASAIGCSSSSSAPTKDGGGQLEASRPPVDARRDTRPKDAEDEAAARDATGPDGAPYDAARDAGACDGLDAALSTLAVAAACASCVTKHCCSLAQACAATAGCVAIESCATKCVATGTAPMTCAVRCIEGDGGVPEAGLTPPQNAAENLDICFAALCNAECS